MKTHRVMLIIFALDVLVGTLFAQTFRQAPPAASPPAAPIGLVALPFYSTNQVKLAWSDMASNESFYEVHRSTDGARFLLHATLPANTTEFVDVSVSVAGEYLYIVRAIGISASGYSNVARQNLTAVMPVPQSNEVLHGWNDTLGSAAVNQAGVPTGFHMGVDFQRIGEDNQVLAVRGGVVDFVSLGPDGHVAVKVFASDGVVADLYSFNHVDRLQVANGDVVYAGQVLAYISESWFPINFTDHTHFAVAGEFLEIQERNPLHYLPNQDPGNLPPGITDHSGDGELLVRRQGAGEYLAGNVAQGDVDLVIELSDIQGLSPTQVPMSVSYWIEAPEFVFCQRYPLPARNYDVGSPDFRFVLFDWSEEYYGQVRDLNLSQAIVDYGQNLQSTINQDGESYPWENYKHFVVTNAVGAVASSLAVDEGEYWNTNSASHATIDEESPDANMADKLDTNTALDSRFPDGLYTVHLLLSDLVHQQVEEAVEVRVDNFPPIVSLCEGQTGNDTFLFPVVESNSFSVDLFFSEEMDLSIPALDIVSIDIGSVDSAEWLDAYTLTCSITPVGAGGRLHRLTVLDSAKDLGGTKLDGDRNGEEGGIQVYRLMPVLEGVGTPLDPYTYAFETVPSVTAVDFDCPATLTLSAVDGFMAPGLTYFVKLLDSQSTAVFNTARITDGCWDNGFFFDFHYVVSDVDSDLKVEASVYVSSPPFTTCDPPSGVACPKDPSNPFLKGLGVTPWIPVEVDLSLFSGKLVMIACNNDYIDSIELR